MNEDIDPTGIQSWGRRCAQEYMNHACTSPAQFIVVDATIMRAICKAAGANYPDEGGANDAN